MDYWPRLFLHRALYLSGPYQGLSSWGHPIDRCAAGPPQTSRCPSQCAVTWTKRGHFKELVWKWKDGLCLYQLYIPHRIHVLGIYTFSRFFLVGTVFFCFEGFTFKDERGHFKIFQGVFENGRIGGDSWPFQNTYVECLGILRFDDFFKGNYSKGPFGRVLCDLQLRDQKVTAWITWDI